MDFSLGAVIEGYSPFLANRGSRGYILKIISGVKEDNMP